MLADFENSNRFGHFGVSCASLPAEQRSHLLWGYNPMQSGDTTPCRMNRATLHGIVSLHLLATVFLEIAPNVGDAAIVRSTACW